MELQSEENGEKISIDHKGTTLGRSNCSSDPSVSRRHVSLTLASESTLSFEVIGKNPILILTNGCKKLCRRGEKGYLTEGDRLSLSIRRPSLWVVKREVERSILEAVKRREMKTMERRREREEREKEESREEVEVNEDFDLEFELEGLDLSNIDPVEEFGFLVMGHEFDKYPNGQIRPMKKWNWYLDTPKENTDNSHSELDDFTHEASTSKSKSSSRSKKRGKDGAEDEDWTGESDEDKDLIAKESTSLKRSKYATRSKDSKKPHKETVKDEEDIGVQDEEIDEDDETLGGFIVTGEEEEEEMNNEEDEEEEEEEEEFDDEEYED
ncbi:hypothetical protein LUZ63_015283 [Rhynchospora breviuscula]|uniref:FHA domain-containing protein n=1 Tax=Rhynchospora breviuscula TaxID=2022672 RepID=A0A9Q0CC09_9POAL|nr:hypothetical protein LUZ63_015283 [Rhynchospora breviuscula]